jgi:hypothetical protein
LAQSIIGVMGERCTASMGFDQLGSCKIETTRNFKTFPETENDYTQYTEKEKTKQINKKQKQNSS